MSLSLKLDFYYGVFPPFREDIDSYFYMFKLWGDLTKPIFSFSSSDSYNILDKVSNIYILTV